MPALTNRQDLPDHAKPVVDLCERLGFIGWEYDYDHPLPDENSRVQVRAEEHNVPGGYSVPRRNEAGR